MATSVVSICNMALGWLGGNLITSLDDDTNEAALCKANYEPARDAVLEDRDWTFATKRRSLSPLTANPAFGYAYQFSIPADMVRILKVSDEPFFRHNVNWEREQDVILMDSQLCYMRYIAVIEDPQKYSKGFVHAVAARLAMDIALPLTNSPEMQQQMTQLYSVKLERAGTMDGMQGPNPSLRVSRLLGVR